MNICQRKNYLCRCVIQNLCKVVYRATWKGGIGEFKKKARSEARIQTIYYCVWQNEYYLCFSVLRVLRCPAVTDRGCQVISGFRCHLALTDSLGLDLMLADRMNLDDLKLFYCEFQKYEVMTTSVGDGQPKKHENHCYKVKTHIERSFLINTSIYNNQRILSKFTVEWSWI